MKGFIGFLAFSHKYCPTTTVKDLQCILCSVVTGDYEHRCFVWQFLHQFCEMLTWPVFCQPDWNKMESLISLHGHQINSPVSYVLTCPKTSIRYIVLVVLPSVECQIWKVFRNFVPNFTDNNRQPRWAIRDQQGPTSTTSILASFIFLNSYLCCCPSRKLTASTLIPCGENMSERMN